MLAPVDVRFWSGRRIGIAISVPTFWRIPDAALCSLLPKRSRSASAAVERCFS
jgi:hypothetical protein